MWVSFTYIHIYIRIPICNLPSFLPIDKTSFISICEQGGSGYVREISFEDIILDKVKTPIDIDQFYPNSINQVSYMLCVFDNAS